MGNNWKKKFAVIYAGQAFSLLGSAAVQFAVIWWLTVQKGSAVTLTLAAVVSCLPNLLFGPFAGVWIDRCNRRTVMIAADGLVALSSAVLGAVFLLTEAPPVWFIYLILFIRGLGNTFHAPAMQAAVPMFVPAELLTKAGGWGNLIVSVSTMLGPALGAVLMGAVPMAAVMLVDIAGAAFAVLCLLTVSIPDVPRASGEVHILADIRSGLTAMGRNKPLMSAFFPIIVTEIFYMPLGSLFPLLVRAHYMGGAWHNAAIQLAFSGGLFVSSFVMGVWGGSKKRFCMISSSIILLGAAALTGGLLPPAGFWGFTVCGFIMGGSVTFFNVPLVAYIQESVAPEMMGKVLSMLTTAMNLAAPFGLLVAGPVSEAAGVDRWFIWSGLLMCITGFVCFGATWQYDVKAGNG